MLISDILQILRTSDTDKIRMYQSYRHNATYSIESRYSKYSLCTNTAIVPLNYNQFNYLDGLLCGLPRYDREYTFEPQVFYVVYVIMPYRLNKMLDIMIAKWENYKPHNRDELYEGIG